MNAAIEEITHLRYLVELMHAGRLVTLLAVKERLDG